MELSNDTDFNLTTPLSSMEASILEGIWKPEDKDINYVDVPEIVTNIKQEIISEEVSESTPYGRIKEECISRSEEQFTVNQLLPLDHLKTEVTENEEILNEWNTTEEKFCIENEDASAPLKKEENIGDGLESPNLIKLEEVDIKGEEDGSTSISSIKYGKHGETKIPRRRFPYKCMECNYQTMTKNHMKSHVLQHKNLKDGDLLKCYKCDYQTYHKGNFVRHFTKCKPRECQEQTTHKVELIKCSDCEYQTFDKRNLNRHVLIHKSSTEIRMHKCNQCEYQTKYKSNLNVHALRHKRRDELEVLKCPECVYHTYDKNNLNNHILRHKSAGIVETYKCLECGYITLKKNNLMVHALRHKNRTEIEMFKCFQCNYQAIRKCDLNRHLLTHNDQGGKKTLNGSNAVMKRLTQLN